MADSDLSKLTVAELRKMAKTANIPTTGLRKADLVEALSEAAEETSGSSGQSSPSSFASLSDRYADAYLGEVDPYGDVRDKLEALSRESREGHPPEPQITLVAALTTYLGYAVLIAFGHLRDFFGLTLSLGSRYISPTPREGVAPLLKSWENFYTRRCVLCTVCT